MNLGKLKIGVVVAIAIAGVMASLVIQHRAEIKIREKDEAWRQQDNQLVALAAEPERVSNVVTQVKSSPSDEQQRELQKLRIEVERLGKQINELETNLESGRRARIALFASTHPMLEYREQRKTITTNKIKNASNLYETIENYLTNHQNQFPSNLNQL